MMTPLEARAESLYRVYLDHLRICPRCGTGRDRIEPCRGASYLRRDLRDARKAACLDRWGPR